MWLTRRRIGCGPQQNLNARLGHYAADDECKVGVPTDDAERRRRRGGGAGTVVVLDETLLYASRQWSCDGSRCGVRGTRRQDRSGHEGLRNTRRRRRRLGRRPGTRKGIWGHQRRPSDPCRRRHDLPDRVHHQDVHRHGHDAAGGTGQGGSARTRTPLPPRLRRGRSGRRHRRDRAPAAQSHLGLDGRRSTGLRARRRRDRPLRGLDDAAAAADRTGQRVRLQQCRFGGGRADRRGRHRNDLRGCGAESGARSLAAELYPLLHGPDNRAERGGVARGRRRQAGCRHRRLGVSA